MTPGVVRIGDTVRRPVGAHTAAVHAVLRHLEEVGFGGAPRVLGIDDRGREVLSWIDGEVAHRPFVPHPVGEAGLTRLGALLRRYHDAVGSWRPREPRRWTAGLRCLRAGEVVLHGDPGPWNVVWRGDVPVALIDWDLAEPGHPIRDVAWAAWYAVPLSRRWEEAGVRAEDDLAPRLAALCEGYGRFPPRVVVGALDLLQQRERSRTWRWSERGREPWASFAARVPLTAWDDERAWFQARSSSFAP